MPEIVLQCRLAFCDQRREKLFPFVRCFMERQYAVSVGDLSAQRDHRSAVCLPFLEHKRPRHHVEHQLLPAVSIFRYQWGQSSTSEPGSARDNNDYLHSAQCLLDGCLVSLGNLPESRGRQRFFVRRVPNPDRLVSVSAGLERSFAAINCDYPGNPVPLLRQSGTQRNSCATTGNQGNSGIFGIFHQFHLVHYNAGHHPGGCYILCSTGAGLPPAVQVGGKVSRSLANW